MRDHREHHLRPHLGDADRAQKLLRNLRERDDVGEARAGTHQDEHDGGDQPGRLRDGPEIRQLERAEHQKLQDDRVEHAGGGRLGRAEHAAIDAADDDHRKAERPDRHLDRVHALGPARLRLGGHAFDRGVDHRVGREQDEQQQTWPDAGDEQLGDRGRGHHAVDDHADRGRDQEGDVARVDDQGEDEAVLVARLQHARAKRRADRDHRRLGRAGDGAEQGAGARRADREPAFHVADEGHDQIDQPIGAFAAGHDVGGEDEHRHRDQGRRPDAAQDLLHQKVHAIDAAEHRDEADDRGRDQGDHHREAEKQQHDHHSGYR